VILATIIAARRAVYVMQAYARPNLTRYIYPQIKKHDLVPILCCSIAGALLAGTYGAIHDQITFSLSAEYFTRLKFRQFDYANLGYGTFVFVSTIGFLATWWLGLFLGWFVGRRFVPNQERSVALRKVMQAFSVVLLTTACFGIGGYIYGAGMGAQRLKDWSWVLNTYRVVDGSAFVQVAYVHNAGYIGAFVGLMLAMIIVHPVRRS
jgi:hypothetical protein